MTDFTYNILSSKDFLFVESILGVMITIVVLFLLFMKTSRDERGRGIIGKASIYSTIYFIIITNVFANILQKGLPTDFYIFANSIQFIYNTVLLVQGTSIFILKKME